MGKRKTEAKEIVIGGRVVVGASQAARLLTKRAREQAEAQAREQGIPLEQVNSREYSRDTIFRHYKNGSLKTAGEPDSGNLYYEDDIMALPISPERGKRSKNQNKAEEKTDEEGQQSEHPI